MVGVDISLLQGSKPQAAYIVLGNQTQVPVDVKQFHVYYLRKCSQPLLGSGWRDGSLEGTGVVQGETE